MASNLDKEISKLTGQLMKKNYELQALTLKLAKVEAEIKELNELIKPKK